MLAPVMFLSQNPATQAQISALPVFNGNGLGKNCINFWSSFSHLWKCDNSSRHFNSTELLGPADELIHGKASGVVPGPMWVLSTRYTQAPCESCKWHITSFIYVPNTNVVTSYESPFPYGDNAITYVELWYELNEIAHVKTSFLPPSL